VQNLIAAHVYQELTQHTKLHPTATNNMSVWLKQKQHWVANQVDNYLQVEALPRSLTDSNEHYG